MTLQVIQAARRLYNTKGKKLPLPMVVELNRRLVKGYTHFKDDPRIVHLRKSIADYNRELRLLGIRDHQVEYARFSSIKVIFTLIARLIKLSLLTIGTLPGLLLFTPVFITTKVISKKKSKEALAASTVKLQGRDVMATWKLLVALAFAPALYAFYTAAFTTWAYHNRIQGTVPEWMPLWLIVPIGMVLFPTITFAALRIGEVGMDILKSLRPLVLSLNPYSANTLVKLRKKRAALAQQVTDAINTLGPELFPDFDAARIVTDPFREINKPAGKAEYEPTPVPEIRRTTTTDFERGSVSQEPLPRNESFHNLANIGFFSTRPSSRSRSRSSSFGGRPGSSGQQLKPLSQVTSSDSFEEVSSKIRDAMRQRGEQRRRRHSEDSNSWDMASSGPGTPHSEEYRKDI
jgi:glycerol-3-phosphate O-acyltransferase/dihydroxyacetone phosphate acyltransferase